MEKVSDEAIVMYDGVGEEGNATEFVLHRLGEQDIPEIIALSDSIGWDYTAEELRTVFATGLMYGHRSTEGVLASTAAIFSYEDQLGSIGAVMVNPNFRRLGLGKAVTQRCMDAVPNTTPIMLIATADGKPLYESIGFHTAETNYKFLGDKYQPQQPVTFGEAYTWTPIQEADFAQVVQLDAAARGAKRETYLKNRFAQLVDHVLVKQGDGTPVGYAFSVQGPFHRVIGPVVAPTPELAIAIIHHLAKDHHGALRVDVPTGEAQEQVRAFLLASGFENVTQPPVMVINADQLPPRNNTLFAIGFQAFG